MSQGKYTSEDMGVIMTSRGCPYKCGFCSHPPKVRYRNLDNVIEEIRYVKALVSKPHALKGHHEG